MHRSVDHPFSHPTSRGALQRSERAGQHSGSQARRAAAPIAGPVEVVVVAALAIGLLLLGCARPGALYPVSPAVSGHLADFDAESGSTRLRLITMHRESKNLHASQEVTPTAEGRFEFNATKLAIAGHEFSKFYRLYLHLQDDRGDRVIWRAQLSRLALSGDVALECDLSRPARLGQACQVVDPLEQEWLVAEGERTFQRLCASCHGPSGERELAGPPSDVRVPPDLRAIAARREGRFDRAAIAERIEGRTTPEAHRRGGMPIWGELLSSEFERYAEGDELVGATLDPLVVYLESLQGASAP